MPRPSRVLFLSRAGCHLCEEAQPVVMEACEAADVAWQYVDIDSDPTLRARWTNDVPVVIIDDVVHSRWHVDRDALAAALAPSRAPLGRA